MHTMYKHQSALTYKNKADTLLWFQHLAHIMLSKVYCIGYTEPSVGPMLVRQWFSYMYGHFRSSWHFVFVATKYRLVISFSSYHKQSQRQHKRWKHHTEHRACMLGLSYIVSEMNGLIRYFKRKPSNKQTLASSSSTWSGCLFGPIAVTVVFVTFVALISAV